VGDAARAIDDRAGDYRVQGLNSMSTRVRASPPPAPPAIDAFQLHRRSADL